LLARPPQSETACLIKWVAGCITGLHQVLRRRSLFEGIWCVDPGETLSPGQSVEIDRVYRAYPHLNDDDFVRARLSEVEKLGLALRHRSGCGK
jgi:hypothetical protein